MKFAHKELNCQVVEIIPYSIKFLFIACFLEHFNAMHYNRIFYMLIEYFFIQFEPFSCDFMYGP